MMAEAILVERGTPSSLVTLFQPYDHQAAITAAKAIEEFNVIISNMDMAPADSEEDLCLDCRTASNAVLEAVTSDHVNCLREMLRLRHVDLHAPQLATGVTLSHVAARKGSVSALQLLIEIDFTLAVAKDHKGSTPLHVSAYHDQLHCLKYLLYNTDSSANSKDSDGATPVHFAAAAGNLECLKELCDMGKGDPNATTNSGETPG